MSNVYVVMYHTHDSDPDCDVFFHEDAAVEFARAAARFRAIGAGVELYDDEDEQIEGWLYHGHYGVVSNGGCVWVVERKPHEER